MEHSVETLQRAIKAARKAHDTASVEALGQMIFEATGVHEPEFAPVASSGNPELDSLRRALVQAIESRDEPSEAALRAKIADIEAEEPKTMPTEPIVELAEEDEVENPFAEREDEEVVGEAELAPLVAEDCEGDAVEVGELFKDLLGPTQIDALRKVSVFTEDDIIRRILSTDDPMETLVGIKGIGQASAKTILETLGYEA